MPVPRAEERHQRPHKLQLRPAYKDGPETSCVNGPFGEYADEQDQEKLDGADPGNGGGSGCWEEGVGIVSFEDAEGICEALVVGLSMALDLEDDGEAGRLFGGPGVREQDPAGEDLHPGGRPTIHAQLGDLTHLGHVWIRWGVSVWL